MIGKTLNYISHHAIAILALVCSLLALAGASYAATQLPKNSVGTAQLKQGAVTPSKLSGKQFGGYVRMYAVVNAHSKLQYSSPQAKLSNWGNSPTAGAVQPGNGLVEADRHGEAVRRVRNRPGERACLTTERRRGRRAEPARPNRHTRRCRLDGRFRHRRRGRLPLSTMGC